MFLQKINEILVIFFIPKIGIVLLILRREMWMRSNKRFSMNAFFPNTDYTYYTVQLITLVTIIIHFEVLIS